MTSRMTSGSVIVALLISATARFASACSDGSTPSWTNVPNSQSYGASQNTSSNSLASCQYSCSVVPWCVGIDFNYNGNTCWLADSTDSVGSTSSSSIVHYNQVCSSILTSQSTGCYWSGQPGTNSPSGSLQSGVNTLPQCQSQCSISTKCLQYGFDWVSATSQCFISNYPLTSSTSGTTHYSWVCPTVQTTPATGCQWNISQSSFSPSGSPQSYTTLTDCQTNCFNLNSCPGFDWNYGGNNGYQCFFSPSNNLIGYGQAPGVVHYQKICAAAYKNKTSIGIVAILLILATILQQT